MTEVKIASSPDDIKKILALRYSILRQPWDQPLESASDGLEAESINAFIAENGDAIACGRLQKNSEMLGQIRFMAVAEDRRGCGLGEKVLLLLEQKAREWEIKKIELHARENAVGFYERQGYLLKEKSYKLWNIIQHYLMEKNL